MLKKNQLIPLEIQSVTNEGNGVGRFEGMAVFVPGTAPGDRLTARVVKVLSSYCYGIVEELLEPGPGRVEPACPVCRRCGGCSLQHLSYPAELAVKEGWVRDSLRRIGGLDAPVRPILGSPLELHYRNKAQYPIAKGKDGAFCGFYAPRSHTVIPAEGCLLQPAFFGEIARAVCRYIDRSGEEPYDEASGKGLFRHLYLRWGEAAGEVMVCLVVNGERIPEPQSLVSSLLSVCPQISSILVNTNTKNTNVILGPKTRVLFGASAIRDLLCGVRVNISPLSFYQVNRRGAELLYRQAAELARLTPEDVLLDLYCGAGTIGLSMARQVREVIGVEVVESAVRDAEQNARENGVENARFLCADAGQAAGRLREEGLLPTVVVLDPPRKGCDTATLEAVAGMTPSRVVMVSCNPATMARDAAVLSKKGYRLTAVQPVDMFPRTAHVETVVLLSKLNTKQHIEVELNLDELDLTAAESKATYDEIKAYVLEKYGLKVSSLYISQVKRKCGLEVGQNYNLSKKEDAKVPQCPPEKEAAIMEALRHFQMI